MLHPPPVPALEQQRRKIAHGDGLEVGWAVYGL